MRSGENYKESRPYKWKSACIASFVGNSFCNGYTDLRSLPILPPFSETNSGACRGAAFISTVCLTSQSHDQGKVTYQLTSQTSQLMGEQGTLEKSWATQEGWPKKSALPNFPSQFLFSSFISEGWGSVLSLAFLNFDLTQTCIMSGRRSRWKAVHGVDALLLQTMLALYYSYGYILFKQEIFE